MQSQDFGVIEVTNQLGEGIFWDIESSSLWWTDILGCTLYKFDLKSQNVESWLTPEPVTAFGLIANSDLLMCGFASGFATFNLKTANIEWLHKIDFADKDMRLNDGAIDNFGQFWCGSMVTNPEVKGSLGELYCLTQGNTVTTKLTNIRVSNGLCWSPESDFLYHTDTPTRQINRYRVTEKGIDFDKCLATLPEGQSPDGATVDKNGNIYVAVWNGHRIERFSPEGELLKPIKLPVSKPTNLAFGGNEMNTLYITTASVGVDPKDEPFAGKVLVCQIEQQGIGQPRYAE